MRLFLPSDWPEYARWNEARGVTPGPLDILPLGFIEPGLAAGFLFVEDRKNVGFLEGFATDPSAPPLRRMRAMLRIGERLEDEARSMGLKVLFATSGVPATVKAAVHLGWSDTGAVRLLGKRI